MNDQKIVQYIKEGKKTKSFIRIYEGFPPIKKLIVSMGGSKDEAEDIFQEALIIFYQKVKREDFVLRSSISTYLYSVSRYLWKDELKKREAINNSLNKHEFINESKSELSRLIENERKFQMVEDVLQSIGEKCLELLNLFYYKKFSMKEIAQKLELKSEKVAKNQKYKCLERARKKLSTSLHA